MLQIVLAEHVQDVGTELVFLVMVLQTKNITIGLLLETGLNSAV